MSTYVTKLAKQFGLKKADAKQPITIEVFPKDVQKAVRYDSSDCAFACAAKRQFPIEGAIFFRSSAWLLFPGGRLQRYMLPKEAMKQIKAFDRGNGFKAGTYQLNVPSKSQSLEAVDKRSKKRPGRHEPAGGKIKRKIVHHAKDVRTTHLPQLPAGFQKRTGAPYAVKVRPIEPAKPKSLLAEYRE